MKGVWSLCCALLAVCATCASAQILYKRPGNYSEDCLPATTRATTFAAVFPSDFFVSGGKISSQDTSTTVSFAKNFEVQYFPTYKVVTNLYANETYVLYQCGGTRPSANAVAGAKVFSIPLTSVSVPDTVPYAFLEILNVTDRVQSVSSLAVAPCAQQLLTCNKTAPSNLSDAATLSATVLPFVDGITATAPIDPPPPATAPIFTFSATQDPGTLNRAEWVKFLGLFFNKETEASQYFETVERQYNRLKTTAAANANKPTVAWISHFVFAPDEYYQISFAPYKVQYTQDAGGQTLSKAAVAATPGVTVDAFDVTNSTFDFAWNGTQKGFESQAQARLAFLQALSNVDIVVDETFAPAPAAYTYNQFLKEYGISPALAANVAFLNGTNASAVLREDGLISPSGGLDWFEGAIAHPEGVLQDLSTALSKPADLGRKFTWFRNVQQDPTVVGPANCTLASACEQAPSPICPLIKECPDGSVVDLVAAGTCKYNSCGGSGNASAAGTSSGGSPGAAPAPAPQAASAAAALAPLAAAATGAALLLAL